MLVDAMKLLYQKCLLSNKYRVHMAAISMFYVDLILWLIANDLDWCVLGFLSLKNIQSNISAYFCADDLRYF